MITYYTAIGKLEIERRNEGKKPTIYKEGEAYELDVYEFCIWTLLAWNFQTYDELLKQYHKKRQELRLFDDQPFNHVLSRLAQRGLVASAMAFTAADAMYELICKLRIHPLHVSRSGKYMAAVYLFFRHGVPLKKILNSLKPYPLDKMQKNILSLTGRILMTPAELIKCMEMGVVKMPSEEKLVDTVYQGDFTYENLHNDTRFSELKDPIMKAIVDLFLNKLIIFE